MALICFRSTSGLSALAVTAFSIFCVAVAHVDVLAGSRPLLAASWTRKEDVKQSVYEVLNDVFNDDPSFRIAQLEEVLLPMYRALPKNSRGLLDHATVRYALHRYFVHEKAMYIKGLEPTGEAWTDASPVSILEDKVPAYVQTLFEEQLYRGFTSHDLATFAATLEYIMQKDALQVLQVAYRLSNTSIGEVVNATQLSSIVDLYFAITMKYLPSNVGVEQARQFPLREQIGTEELALLDEVLNSSVEHLGIAKGSIPFFAAQEAVFTLAAKYGQRMDRECRILEALLAGHSLDGQGRVPLSTFYQAGPHFLESQEFLETNGVLDTSDPKQPRVMIANYINSAMNCYETSGIFSYCCVDQCEELMAQLERDIAAPEVSPEKLAELVTALPSPTVPAPHQLSASLLQRLDEIALLNGGLVPLHGRLFGQWLHHAYPRECAYPHSAGSTKPQAPSEWFQETGQSAVHLATDLPKVIQGLEVKDLVDGDLQATLPWLAQEELVARHSRSSLAHELRVVIQALVFAGMLFSFLLSILRTALLLWEDELPSKAKI